MVNQKEKDNISNKKEYTIRTDRLNSRSRFVKLSDFRVILPPNSVIKVNNGLRIERLEVAVRPIKDDLKTLLFKAVEDCGNFDAVLVSGGIDSSIIALIAGKIKKDCSFILVGFEDSEDMSTADYLEHDLGKKILRIVIKDSDVKLAIEKLKKLDLDTYNLILGVVEYIAVQKAKSLGYKKVLSGLGSDELFFGFHIHQGMSATELQKFREERLFYLTSTDLMRINKISEAVGVSIAAPYLNDYILDYALALDIKVESDSYNKALLRQLGKDLGLSSILSERKKKAMQYGSGVVKSLERLSKKENVKNVGEFIRNI